MSAFGISFELLSLSVCQSVSLPVQKTEVYGQIWLDKAMKTLRFVSLMIIMYIIMFNKSYFLLRFEYDEAREFYIVHLANALNKGKRLVDTQRK